MHAPKAFVTTCSAARTAEAVVLARTFLAHHPDASATVVVSDAEEAPSLEEPGLTLQRGADVGCPVFEVLAAGHAPDALARALAPWAIERLERPAVWIAGEAVVTSAIDLGGDLNGLVLRADAQEATVVDPEMAVAMDSAADAPLAAWRDDVTALRAGQPLARVLATSEAVTLQRSPAWGAGPTVVQEDGIGDHLGELVLSDGAPVQWLRVGPGMVSDVLLDARAARDDAARRLPEIRGGYAVTAAGVELDERLRRLFADGVRRGELSASPFSRAGSERFDDWLRDADPSSIGGGVGRFCLDVWRTHPDLQAAYADLGEASVRDGFLGWLAVHWDGLGYPLALRPGPAPAPTPARPDPVGVNVAGYFHSEIGVGEVARRVIHALDTAHVSLMPVQGAVVPSSRRREEGASTSLAATPFDVNLVCVNADGLPHFADEAGPAFFTGRRTIGLWWWELPTFPARFAGAFEHVDEVWVGSRYVQEAITPVSPVPVLHMPVAVAKPRVTAMSRQELGLPEGFLVLFMFDLHSVSERKNPAGLIEAFDRAFGDDPSARLVLKCINGEHHREELQELRLAVRGHPNVELREDYVSAAERDAMLAACDCYASLHRSEGFGLTLAEAMALGRPTVATGWSGNLDFMTEETSWLVPFELVPVGEGNAPYDADDHWAEPDLDAAAAALREVRDDPDGARLRAQRGAASIVELRNPAVAGEAMRARLEALRPQVAAAASAGREQRRLELEAGLALARARTARGPEDYSPPGGSRLKRAVRGALARGLRPAVANQQATDQLVLDAMEDVTRSLAEQVEAALAAQGSLTAAVLAAQRRLERR